MEQQELEWNQNSLPSDVVLKILSLLQVEDVCCLGSCSKYFHEVCTSDCLWITLYRDRWPASMMIDFTNSQLSSIQGWRSFYMERHNDMAGKITSMIENVDRCSASQAIEVGEYQKAVAHLQAMELGFKDVVMFLFASKQNALLNLVGLHYLLFCIGIPAECVVKALCSCHISERQVCVKWWKLGRWSRGFRLRDESYSRKVSLADLAVRREEVLGVLHRGALHEVLRVQILVPDSTCISWTYRIGVAQG